MAGETESAVKVCVWLYYFATTRRTGRNYDVKGVLFMICYRQGSTPEF